MSDVVLIWCKKIHETWGKSLNKQLVLLNGICVSLLCILSFRVEVKEKRTQKLYPANGIQK